MLLVFLSLLTYGLHFWIIKLIMIRTNQHRLLSYLWLGIFTGATSLPFFFLSIYQAAPFVQDLLAAFLIKQGQIPSLEMSYSLGSCRGAPYLAIYKLSGLDDKFLQHIIFSLLLTIPGAINGLWAYYRLERRPRKFNLTNLLSGICSFTLLMVFFAASMALFLTPVRLVP